MTEQQLLAHRSTLLAYLRAKADIEDWHGVSDAANDLREIDVALRMLRSGQYAPVADTGERQ